MTDNDFPDIGKSLYNSRIEILRMYNSNPNAVYPTYEEALVLQHKEEDRIKSLSYDELKKEVWEDIKGDDWSEVLFELFYDDLRKDDSAANLLAGAIWNSTLNNIIVNHNTKEYFSLSFRNSYSMIDEIRKGLGDLPYYDLRGEKDYGTIDKQVHNKLKSKGWEIIYTANARDITKEKTVKINELKEQGYNLPKK